MTRGQKETQRQKQRYAEKRAELIAALGGKCECCGGNEALSFDHIDGRDYELNKMNRLQRLRVIEREIKEGVGIRLLCDRCNTMHRWGYLPPTNINMERLFKYNEEA